MCMSSSCMSALWMKMHISFPQRLAEANFCPLIQSDRERKVQMVDPITMNARKPKDDSYGQAMLHRMNERHKPLYKWGLEHVSLDTPEAILDIGFGGGQNIKNLLHLAPQAKISGIDYSEASYRKCEELNREAIEEGRVSISLGTAENLPCDRESFDLVTAFETIYYWENIENCFKNIYDSLKKEGVFLICNEDVSSSGIEDIARALHMRFYSEDQLKKLLHKAGFQTVHTYLHPRGNWICAVGTKQ